jgi:hypothetical protein
MPNLNEWHNEETITMGFQRIVKDHKYTQFLNMSVSLFFTITSLAMEERTGAVAVSLYITINIIF